MNQEEEYFKKRLKELADQAYQNNCYTFTDFLSLQEQSCFLEEQKNLCNPSYTLWGGQEGCERQMLRFGDPGELGYEVPFPIVCIAIKPLLEKFAENLSHRDYLGALMNLGIERKLVGDILIHGKTAYVFVCEKIAGYIKENLGKIRHTNIVCTIPDTIPDYIKPKTEFRELIVASERLDGIVAKFCKITRSQADELFREKKVFLNSRLCENTAHRLAENDIITVRGYGKFYYRGIRHETKKEKLCIQIEQYQS